MSLTESEYDALTKRYSQNSKPWINVPKAFLIGGGICALGQGLIEGYTRLGLPADLASGACSMTLVVLSALCTGLGIYDQIARHGRAPVPWYPSPALPMPWFHRPWNSKAKA